MEKFKVTMSKKEIDEQDQSASAATLVEKLTAEAEKAAETKEKPASCETDAESEGTKDDEQEGSAAAVIGKKSEENSAQTTTEKPASGAETTIEADAEKKLEEKSSETDATTNAKPTDADSGLPYHIIDKLLCLAYSTKLAIQTCLKVKPWWKGEIWKSLSDLRLDDINDFQKFVTGFLETRAEGHNIRSLELTKEGFPADSVNAVIAYALSHNVEKMVLHFKYLSFSSSKSLTSLSLYDKQYRDSRAFPDSLELPCLVYLELRNINFSHRKADPKEDVDASGVAEPFTSFTKLTDLILEQCGSQHIALVIKNPNLSYFGLHVTNISTARVILDTPKLHAIGVSVGALSRNNPRISCVESSSVKSVGIHYISLTWDQDLAALGWLAKLYNVEKLVVNSGAIQAFSKQCRAFGKPSFFEKFGKSMFGAKLKKFEIKRDKGCTIPAPILQQLTEHAPLGLKIEVIPHIQ